MSDLTPEELMRRRRLQYNWAHPEPRIVPEDEDESEDEDPPPVTRA